MSKWSETKEIRKRLDGYKCQYCGSTLDLQVHHKNYDNYYDVDALVTVCRKCHIMHTNDIRDKKRLEKLKRQGHYFG